MKKQIRKATAKRRTSRILKVAFLPLREVILIISEDAKISKAEKSKMKKLEIQKQYLKSEANSKKEALQYKEMLLPEERARLQVELQQLQEQIKENIDKHRLLMGKRAERKRRRFMQCALMAGLFVTVAGASYLMATGAMTVLGF